jgi:hypothetical protein
LIYGWVRGVEDLARLVFAGLISTLLGKLPAGWFSRFMTASATSSGVSFHESSSSFERVLNSVDTDPGMITLTRMLSNRTSCISDSLNEISAAFEAQ